ncbi:type VI secretion system secreted protein VgrG [Variovorax paradoxus]|uniref:type VI secretion system Vgr family protein n=1 Tax=Variovorax paradoxus TaxID=34073 RepID=UPI002794BFE2|nr:type VI secretion system tip protein TssI/VgrG [Variovorax paradoxus]MDQ0573007.1 type VI secretion system secreted protein VgrG [Variovorax paradoxus]
MARVVRAHTPLGEDQLQFRSMHGTEGLSQLFEFEVDLLSPSASIDMKAVLGKSIALEIQTAGVPRFLNGQVVRFSMIGREGGTSRHTVYRATVRPWLWYLTRSSDNKIFQNKTVVEVLEEVLGDYDFPFEKKLSGTYRQWEHCVQYNETDLAFVSRLMELEGIYYYFKHDKNQHTLVLTDDITAHEPMPGYETINYFAADRDVTEDMEVIDNWQVTAEIRSGSYTVDDYNFTTPGADLSGVRSMPQPYDHSGYEMYEWLGEYTNPGEGEHYARVRLEEAQSMADRSVGHATVRGMASGHTFSMQNSPRSDDNREYLIVSVNYMLREGGYASGAAPGEYSFNFVVQPTSLPFRAPRTTQIPRTTGPQTAVVVGPEGEEIWTDQYGRVKVQFRWDRSGRRNENCSCFVRVSHVIAGDGFGAVFTPRIGQEVVIDFVDGRADRPLVVGRVYNPRQMPPFNLPGEQTKSGFVTRSTPGGSPATANSLVFEDKMGAEFVALHAERDLNVSVEKNETHDTGGTRTTVITGHESATYKDGEERHITNGAVETIDGGETRTVTGGATEKVSGGETRTISDGATETITGGETRTVSGGMTETINGGLTQTINDGVTETITGGINSTITGGVRQTISGGVNLTVNDGMNFTVNGGFHSNVLGDHTTIVQGGKTTTTTGPDTTNTPEKTTNTPKHTVNAASEGWWRNWDNHGTLEHTGLWVGALDVYGFKTQVSLLNAQFNGTFVNISRINMLDAKLKIVIEDFNVRSAKVSTVRGGLCVAAKKLFIRT